MNYAIVVSEFNAMITDKMLEECLRGFREQGVESTVIKVPGAFEIPLATQNLFETKSADAVVTLGAVIKGETEHYEAVCNACTDGIMNTMLKYNKPVVFEVLMTDTYKKAEERIEKAYHAAFVAVRMAKMIS